jgi:hypothetical protein
VPLRNKSHAGEPKGVRDLIANLFLTSAIGIVAGDITRFEVGHRASHQIADPGHSLFWNVPTR